MSIDSHVTLMPLPRGFRGSGCLVRPATLQERVRRGLRVVLACVRLRKNRLGLCQRVRAAGRPLLGKQLSRPLLDPVITHERSTTRQHPEETRTGHTKVARFDTARRLGKRQNGRAARKTSSGRAGAENVQRTRGLVNKNAALG